MIATGNHFETAWLLTAINNHLINEATTSKKRFSAERAFEIVGDIMVPRELSLVGHKWIERGEVTNIKARAPKRDLTPDPNNPDLRKSDVGRSQTE